MTEVLHPVFTDEAMTLMQERNAARLEEAKKLLGSKLLISPENAVKRLKRNAVRKLQNRRVRNARNSVK